MISAIDAWTAPFPLRRPVMFGELRYDARDYCVVRVTDHEGTEGVAWCLARGAPLEATVMTLAPLALGKDAWQSERLWAAMYGASIPYGQRGLALRALSLIDIAVWDLRGRLAGVPVHALLGSARERVPVSVGGAYFREVRDPADIAGELRGYVDAGFSHIKIPGGGLAPAEEEAWVASAREAVGDSVALAVDAHWSWHDVRAARAVLARWEQFGLDWVEDPLPPEAVAAAAELRALTSVPLAIGDEQSGRWLYRALLDARAADLWRVDVACVGGFTEARRVSALASTGGIALSTHIYPELHVHLAAAEEGVVAVEYTTPESDIDLAHRFVAPYAAPEAGYLQVPDGPGLGVEIDWERVVKVASSSSRRALSDGD
jgi:L-alanine-DL-glutamate epimerase-like enolase superfamily enzyme